MNRKLRNTIGLVALLLIILLAGGIYIFGIQRGDLEERKSKLAEINTQDLNTDKLLAQYDELLMRSAELDSILADRKFNIPHKLSSIKFFNFINDVSKSFRPETQINIEFAEQKPDKEFFFFEYKLSGNGDYNDVQRLIYSIEQAKELKKISSTVMTNYITTDKEGVPRFYVSYTLVARVYFATDTRFATAVLVENDLSTRPLYDIFYPLIRNDIPPNIDGLLDVQGAKLLAIIPEGAFIADTRGNTFLLWEGEQVYLGYLTKIHYEQNKVDFILNKGGIIEHLTLNLENEKNEEKTKK
jgi:hypothetical protein